MLSSFGKNHAEMKSLNKSHVNVQLCYRTISAKATQARKPAALHCSIEGYDTQKVTLLCIVFAYLIPNLHRGSDCPHWPGSLR